MRARLHRAVRAVVDFLDARDVFVFGGLGCVVIGLAQIYAPLAWITAGVALFWLGVRQD